MAKAIFITGFSNWGKTSIIYELCRGFINSQIAEVYNLDNIITKNQFIIEAESNDDATGINWINKRIIPKLIRNENSKLHLLTALCPAIVGGDDNITMTRPKQKENNFVDLLNHQCFDRFDESHIILLKNRWDYHAQLIPENIINYTKTKIINKPTKFHIIDNDTQFSPDNYESGHNNRLVQVRETISKIKGL